MQGLAESSVLEKKIVLQPLDTCVKDLLDLDTFQSSFEYLKFVTLEWACSLAVECSPRMFKALCCHQQ